MLYVPTNMYLTVILSKNSCSWSSKFLNNEALKQSVQIKSFKNSIREYVVYYHFVVNFVEVDLADFVDNLFAFVRNKPEP